MCLLIYDGVRARYVASGSCGCGCVCARNGVRSGCLFVYKILCECACVRVLAHVVCVFVCVCTSDLSWPD